MNPSSKQDARAWHAEGRDAAVAAGSTYLRGSTEGEALTWKL